MAAARNPPWTWSAPAAGRTTVLQGAVHLVILVVYLVTTLIP
jgi:Ca2+/H+ antiporter